MNIYLSEQIFANSKRAIERFKIGKKINVGYLYSFSKKTGFISIEWYDKKYFTCGDQ